MKFDKIKTRIKRETHQLAVELITLLTHDEGVERKENGSTSEVVRKQ